MSVCLTFCLPVWLSVCLCSHSTGATQWDHPEMTTVMHKLGKTALLLIWLRICLQPGRSPFFAPYVRTTIALFSLPLFLSDGMNDIQYGAYRTAMKLRAVQKACHRKLKERNKLVVVDLFLTLGHHFNLIAIGITNLNTFVMLPISNTIIRNFYLALLQTPALPCSPPC